ncbi:MAG: ABC transporter permease subunit [Roseburia sp.]|nr:ABC transporter permease subunit [Roseburia sp.]MCM1241840.1 ABC transporter permease subunit [Roseburia sp.]
MKIQEGAARMRNFGILYRYEIKKILMRKIVWAACLIILIVSVVVISADVTGKYYVDGKVYGTHYHMMTMDRAYARALNARALDDELLWQMLEAYSHVPTDVPRYSMTEEYQTYARPYSAIFGLVRRIMRYDNLEEMLTGDPDGKMLYAEYAKTLENERKYANLTENESYFWQKKEAQLETPFVFYYTDGYGKLIASAYSLCLSMLLFTAVCLSGIFMREHIYRTDQLLLSSRFGKKTLYFAKTAAGLSFIAVSTLIMTFIVVILSLTIYGADGFGAALQLLLPLYPYPLRVGQGVIIVYVLLLLAVLVTGVFVMMLSELLKSENAALALICGLLFASVFINVPSRFKILSIIWSCLPGNVLHTGRVFGLEVVSFFGHFLTVWQAAPILYLLAGGAFVVIGMRRYTII